LTKYTSSDYYHDITSKLDNIEDVFIFNINFLVDVGVESRLAEDLNSFFIKDNMQYELVKGSFKITTDFIDQKKENINSDELNSYIEWVGDELSINRALFKEYNGLAYLKQNTVMHDMLSNNISLDVDNTNEDIIFEDFPTDASIVVNDEYEN
jgi:hypothetical protein